MAKYRPVDLAEYQIYDRDLDATVNFRGPEVTLIEWDDMEAGGHPSDSDYFMLEFEGDDMPYTAWLNDMQEPTRLALLDLAESYYNDLA